MNTKRVYSVVERSAAATRWFFDCRTWLLRASCNAGRHFVDSSVRQVSFRRRATMRQGDAPTDFRNGGVRLGKGNACTVRDGRNLLQAVDDADDDVSILDRHDERRAVHFETYWLLRLDASVETIQAQHGFWVVAQDVWKWCRRP